MWVCWLFISSRNKRLHVPGRGHPGTAMSVSVKFKPIDFPGLKLQYREVMSVARSSRF